MMRKSLSAIERVQRAIEEIHHGLLKPRVQDALGQASLGLLQRTLDLAQPVEVINGEVSTPWQNQNAVPVALISPGEPIIIEVGSLTPDQCRRAIDKLANIHPRPLAEYAQNVSTAATKTESIDRAAAGMTISQQTAIVFGSKGITAPTPDNGITPPTPDNTFLVSHQPVVILNEQSETNQGRKGLCSTLVHELCHAGEQIEHPIERVDSYPQSDDEITNGVLRKELEAYSVEARYVRSRYPFSSTIHGYSSVAFGVEYIRRAVNGPYDSSNAFDPNDRIKQLLAQGVYGHIYR